MHETYDSESKRQTAPKNYPVRLGIIGGVVDAKKIKRAK